MSTSLNLSKPIDADPLNRAGRVIAEKYELLRLLGEGGMGRVWLARNLSLDTEVAIKLIQPDIFGAETTDRLLQEARATARLTHPSVVRVYDFGTDGGQPFIVMEVLEGESLSSVLDTKGRLPATQAVALLLPVAAGLAAAHDRGVVHRDLKPDNVVLTKDQRGRLVPKVLDFGVARLEPTDRTTQRSLTRAGVVGTPDYMSPEQAKGRRDVDARSDVWAFAVVLYECLTGKRPFRADNYHALLTAICEEEPVATTLHLAGDAELWVVVARGLEKDRELRWQSMREFGVALSNWALGHGLTTDATGSSLEQEWTQRALVSVDDWEVLPDAGAAARLPVPTVDAGGGVTAPAPVATTPLTAASSPFPAAASPRRRRVLVGVVAAAAVGTVVVGLSSRRIPGSTRHDVQVPLLLAAPRMTARAPLPPPAIAASVAPLATAAPKETPSAPERSVRLEPSAAPKRVAPKPPPIAPPPRPSTKPALSEFPDRPDF